jgi:hypothetical protein
VLLLKAGKIDGMSHDEWAQHPHSKRRAKKITAAPSGEKQL